MTWKEKPPEPVIIGGRPFLKAGTVLCDHGVPQVRVNQDLYQDMLVSSAHFDNLVGEPFKPKDTTPPVVTALLHYLKERRYLPIAASEISFNIDTSKPIEQSFQHLPRTY